MRTKTVVAFAIAATAALVLAGCNGGGSGGGSTNSSGSITIGVVGPTSGASALDAKQLNNGYQLAVNEANAKGGVGGKQVKLVFGDAGTPEQGNTTAQRLITSEKASVLIGTYISGVSDTASQTAARYQIPYWDTNALAINLTQRGLDNFFRIGMNSEYFGASVADSIPLFEEAVGKDAKDITVFIEHEDSIYGTTVADAQQAAFKAAGMTVVANASHSAAASDLTASVLRAKQANPDIWAVTGYTADSILLLRTAQAQNWRAPVIFGGGTGQAVEEALGAKYLQGILNTNYPHDLNPAFGPGSDKFLVNYKKTFNEEPKLPQAMTAYAGMQVLLQVLDSTGGDAKLDKFSAAAMALDLPKGTLPTGSGVKFNADRQNINAVTIIDQWQDGVAKTVSPKSAVPEGNALVPTH
jgi:branched-chain amino acid transport system substrate-binding protein